MGNLSRAHEQSREAWTFVRLQHWAKDARHSLRVLSRTPVFTVSAVLTLAFGIGANTAIFTLIDALLLRGLPVPESDRIVQVVFRDARNASMSDMSYPIFEDMRAQVRSLSGLFTWNATDLSTGWGTDARRLVGAAVSGHAFSTLEVSAQAGRVLLPSDDVPGAPHAVVISDSFWAREFNRDPRAMGKKLLLNQSPFTVVGVLPASFLGVMIGTSPDVIVTIHAIADLSPGSKMLQENRIWFLSVFGKLKPGVNVAEARAELSVISPSLLKTLIAAGMEFWTNGQKFSPSKLSLVPAAGSSLTAQRWRQSLLILMGVSGLLLLLACVNLASLSLARTAARQKELALRLALGAGRGRIVRQLLTESLMISAAGTLLGTCIAIAATRALIAFVSTDGSPLVLSLSPDWRLFAFTASIAIATGLLVGAGPVLGGSKFQPNDALKQTKIGSEQGRNRFRLGRVLVAVQVGLAVVLATNAMLLVRTLENLKDQKLGFNRSNVVFVSLDASKAGLSHTQLARLYTDLLQGLRRDPQIRSVGLTNITPLGGAFGWETLSAVQWPSLSAQERMLYNYDITPRYFQALGLPLLRGRDFVASDSSSSIPAAILSSSAARAYFPKQDPVGQLLRVNETTSYRIIGEVADAKYASLRDKAPLTMYQKMSGYPYCDLAVRSELDRSMVVQQVRELLKRTGRDVRLGDSIAMTEQIDRALVSERLIATLGSMFALLAAVLVAIGLLGVVGYSVARRTSEIGVRLALGSSRGDVVSLILREALMVVGIGLLTGIPFAMGSAHLMRSFLYGVESYDPVTLTATAAAILLVTMAAAFRPAFLASRLDPITALRCE